jgi:hypothetical protein
MHIIKYNYTKLPRIFSNNSWFSDYISSRGCIMQLHECVNNSAIH